MANPVIAIDKVDGNAYNLELTVDRMKLVNKLFMENIDEDGISDDGIFFEAMDAYCEVWRVISGVEVYIVDSSRCREMGELASERQHVEGR